MIGRLRTVTVSLYGSHGGTSFRHERAYVSQGQTHTREHYGACWVLPRTDEWRLRVMSARSREHADAGCNLRFIRLRSRPPQPDRALIHATVACAYLGAGHLRNTPRSS